MSQHEKRFIPQYVDEQFERLVRNASQTQDTPESHAVESLQAIYREQIQNEQQTLERMRQRLSLTLATQQQQLEDDTNSQASTPVRMLPTRRSIRHRFTRPLELLVAIFIVCVLVGSSLVVFTYLHLSTLSGSSNMKWRVVPSPILQTSQNIFWGVSAASTNDVWAVGDSVNGSVRTSLIEHWDGKQWSLVTHPDAGSGPTLQGVAAIAANNAWVVGTYADKNNTGYSVPLIEHWNGHTWSIVSCPNPGTGGSSLSGIVGIATNNIWAVGETYTNNVSHPLIEHWNGKAWSVVSETKNQPSFGYLNQATAISADDIWAVGYLMGSGANQNMRRSLIEHWNGRTWSIIPAMDLQTVNSQLFSVSAVSSNDVWAVGTLENSPSKPLIEHWNGKQWTTSPIPDGLENSFNSVTAVSSNDVWAVGSTNNSSGQPTLAVHWDGAAWNTVEMASATTQCQNELIATTSVPYSNQVWAVGDYTSNCRSPSATLVIQPLIETNG